MTKRKSTKRQWSTISLISANWAATSHLSPQTIEYRTYVEWNSVPFRALNRHKNMAVLNRLLGSQLPLFWTYDCSATCSSLKQQSACKHATTLCHIILIPANQHLLLLLYVVRRCNKYQFHSFQLYRIRTHYLPTTH